MSIRRIGKRKELGRMGELRASQYVERTLGWNIEARNWRCYAGEADLIADDGGTKILIEVRTRQSYQAGSAIDSVDWKKRLTLRKIATYLEWQLGLRADRAIVRVDIIAWQMHDGYIVGFHHLRDILN